MTIHGFQRVPSTQFCHNTKNGFDKFKITHQKLIIINNDSKSYSKSSNLCLLGWYDSVWCKCQIRHICVCITPTEIIYGLYCNYVEWTLEFLGQGLNNLVCSTVIEPKSHGQKANIQTIYPYICTHAETTFYHIQIKQK